MSEHKPAQSVMLDAANVLDEISAQLLFLAVSVAHAWDDHPADGLVYFIDGIRDRIKTTSAHLAEAVQVLAKPQSHEPPLIEPTAEQEAIARRFREDWDRAGRDAAAEMKAGLGVHREEQAPATAA